MEGSETAKCPYCAIPLILQAQKMTLQIQSCPRHHGVFVGSEQVHHVVAHPAAQRLQRAIRAGVPTSQTCPSNGDPLRQVQLEQVTAKGCAACGSLWFDHDTLLNHVLEVRRRAWGVNSFAARVDVNRDAATFLPAEVVAGLLTDYELVSGEASNTD